ncbi:hypothetical protein QYF36_016134 [Acer negundo]|nr:hypothetical protein QYF36_016134 [Acer negundo]
MVALSTTPMVTLSIVLTTMTKSVGTKFISWISAAKFSSLYEQRVFKGNLSCKIKLGHDKYWIERSARSKAAFRIVDINGDAIAEVNRKQTSSGILLGEDVLSLRVEPRVDHSFIVALVIVYGLINGKM